jgi:hypothetical protein
VLYTGNEKWEEPIRLDELMDVPEELRRFVPSFDTLFLNVKGEEERDFLQMEHPLSWLLAAIRQENADKATFAYMLRRAVERLSQLPEEEIHQWTRAMYYLVLLIYHRRPPTEHVELREIVEQSVKDKRRRKEMEEMTQTIAEHFIQEGEARGERRGERRGGLKAKREDILRLLRFRFDDVPPAVEKRVNSVRSIDHLNTLFNKALRAQNISEITNGD